MRRLATTILLLLPLFIFSQRNFYVAANGANVTFAQAQNINTPWQTIAQVLAQWNNFAAGDIINFRRGDVFAVPSGGFTITKAGAAGNPITVGAYGSGARPVFDGFTTITSGQWASIGGGLYTFTIPSGQSAWGNLLFDGVFQPISQYPRNNNQYININNGTPGVGATIANGGTGTIVSTSTSGNNTISLGTVPGGEAAIVGYELVYRPRHWVLWKSTVTAVNTGSHTITIAPVNATSGGGIYSPIYTSTGYGFFFQNHPNLCTALGDWAYNTSSHVLTVFFGGGGPTGHTVRFNSVANVIVDNGFANVTFNDLNIQGGYTNTVLLGGAANNITFQRCNIDYGGVYGILPNSTSSGLQVLNCNLNRHGSDGLQLLVGTPTNLQLISDTIRNTGMVRGMGGSGEGQYVGVHAIRAGSTMRNCRVTASGYHAIVFLNNPQIINNFVDSFCVVKDDGGGIYHGGNSVSGSLVSGNIVGDGIGLPQGTPDPERRAEGIYSDDGGSNGNFVGNTIFNCGDAGIFNHASFGMTYTNNTMYNNTYANRIYNNTNQAGTISQIGNIYFSLTAGQQCFNSSSGSTSVANFFTTSNNNFWCRPIAETTVFFTPQGNFTLPTWKTFTGKDAASVTTPWTITNVNQVLFIYNASNSPVTTPLAGNYTDVRSVVYPSTITLQPWTSAILKATGGAPPVLAATTTVATNPVTCFGNTTSVTVNASGGVPPYQYRIGAGTFGSTNVFTGLTAGTYTFQVRDAALTVVSVNATINQPSQITISQSSGTITVNGGSTTTTVTASGGTGTLQYSRDGGTFQSSNVFTGVAAGTHTITVRDANNCTNTLTYTLTQPSVLVVSAVATTNPLTCFGNTTTITVTASGATSPYQYQINGGSFQSSNLFTGQGAGTYTITARDAAGALATTTVTITQPTQITITESHTAILVNGGTSTVTITASGGTGTKNYSLDGGTFQSSNVFAGVLAGNHSVVVRDANLCTNTISFTITQPSSLNVSASATTNPLTCFGNTTTITVTATGGTSPYQYSINGGTFGSSNLFTNRGAGTYTLTVRDAALVTQTTTVTITQPTQIAITESHTNIVINGGTSTVTITASGGTGTKNYSIDGGSFQASNSFTGVIAGNHTVTVRDANLCTNTLTFTITQPTALVVGSSVTTAIACNGGSGVISVTASGGTTPYQYRISTGAFSSTNTFTVTAGTYQFFVQDAGGAIASTTTTISQPAIITVNVSISGAAPATVTVIASGGVAPLQYRLDAGSLQSSNVFSNVSAGNHTVTVRDANACLQARTFNVGTPLTFNLVVGTILCNGGTTTVAVNATGGTPPYNGTGTFTRAAGTWTFTVNDVTGATADTTITIPQPAIMAVSEGHTAIIVNGGTSTVTITATGGTGSKTYSLDGGSFQSSNVFAGVSAGNHSVIVKDANSCQATLSFTITQPSNLSIGIVVGTAIACNGGTTTVTVSGTGGTTPYTYGKNGTFQSSTSFTAITAGTYTFSVKDAFSNQHDTIITITQPSALTLSVVTGTIAVNGGNTTVDGTGAGGTGGLTYSLDGAGFVGSGHFTGVLAGSHTLRVKDANACITTNTFSISQPDNLIITISRGAAATCYGGTQNITVGATGGTTPYTGTGVFAKLDGTYTFTVTDAFGAVADTIITVTAPSQITINVVTGTIAVNGGTTTVTASASGGTGGLQYSLDGGAYQGSGVFASVAAGSHTVTVKDANNCTNVNTFSISQPGVLFITATPTTSPLTCYGNTTTVTVSGAGGTTPFTYGKNGSFQGSGTFNSIAAGTYTFSVKDAFNAQHDTVITITQPPLITLLNVAIITPITTYGGTGDIVISNAGGTPINDSLYQYNIDGGGYVLSDTAFAFLKIGITGGQHTVVVKDDNGCTNTFSFIVQQPAAPLPYRVRSKRIHHIYQQL